MDLLSLLKQNLVRRQSYLEKNRIEAFRLYDRTHFQLPLAIDIYQDNAVIHVFDRVSLKILHDVETALRKLQNITACFYKNRCKEQNLELPSNTVEHKEIIVEEYGHKFALNLSDYLDTGLFLDHRETRKWVSSQCQDKIVLNTFAYTGSFSIYAAKAGAQKTYSVDLSKTYCEWIKKNLEVNHLPLEQNWVYKMNTFEFFRYAARKKLLFDIIIIDPPSFSKDKGTYFSVEKDYVRLLEESFPLLQPDGFIVFSNNFKNFWLDKKKLSSGMRIHEKKLTPTDFDGPKPHHCFVISR